MCKGGLLCIQPESLCMKHCIFLAILLPLAALVVAQQPPLSSDVKKKLAELQRQYTVPSAKVPAITRVLPSQDTGKMNQYRKLLEAQRLQRGGLVTATYSHKTARGKVYTLTPDNMPCLVPDKKAVAAMPNAGGLFVPGDRMNALPQQRIIPEGNDKDKDKQ